MGHPSDVDPTRFQLMAPYEKDPRRWLELPWINRYDGKEFAITTVGDTGGPCIARVRTYADVLAAYGTHPEVKSCGPYGEPCGRNSVGLLRPRPVQALWVRAIGKESNKLDEVDVGLEHEWDDVRNVYADLASEWKEVLLQLNRVPKRALAVLSGVSERTIAALRNRRRPPRYSTQTALTEALIAWSQERV
jgi:hypothetical protein